jgi:hypothetical protein
VGTLPKRDEIKVKKVTLKGSKVKIDLGNRVLTAKIKIEPHVLNTASWFHTIGKEIRVDNDLASNKVYLRSLALHEIIEERVYRDVYKGLPSKERQEKSHNFAEKIERDYFISHWGRDEWQKYMRKVNRVYKIENKKQK